MNKTTRRKCAMEVRGAVCLEDRSKVALIGYCADDPQTPYRIEVWPIGATPSHPDHWVESESLEADECVEHRLASVSEMQRLLELLAQGGEA